MLRTWSSQNKDMTSRESTPKSRSSRDISLANDTLVAWKALQAYLSASAMRTSTTRTGWPRKPNRWVTASATRGSRVPTTTKGAAKKSAIPEPSRRNSGHIAVADGDPGAGQAAGERRGHHVLDRPRGHRAADDDAVLAGRRRRRDAQRRRDVVHGAPQVGQVRAAACRRRRARRTPATPRPRPGRRGPTSSRATCRRPPPARRAHPGPARPPGCGRPGSRRPWRRRRPLPTRHGHGRPGRPPSPCRHSQDRPLQPSPVTPLGSPRAGSLSAYERRAGSRDTTNASQGCVLATTVAIFDVK